MMTQHEIDAEVCRLIAYFKSKTNADFEIPGLVKKKIMLDNFSRKKPYRVGYARIERLMRS